MARAVATPASRVAWNAARTANSLGTTSFHLPASLSTEGEPLHGQVRTDALKKGGGYHRDEVWNNALRVKKTFSEDRDLQEKRKGARAALPNR